MSKKAEVINAVENWLSVNLESILPESESCWQPADFLPNMSQLQSSFKSIVELQQMATDTPAELIFVLIGNMITEEALPSYQTWFNLIEGFQDNNGLENAWVKWSRQWTAEENRHGDLLNRYLYLTGKVNMSEVERAIQNLIRNGFEPRTENNPYHSIVYTSFQERATKIAHVNTARLADKAGNTPLSKICRIISGDESRHERAYKAFFSKILEYDPDGGIMAFMQMMKKQITMPGARLGKAQSIDLFDLFADHSSALNIYTTWDYADIIDHLNKFWGIDKISVSGDAAKAQDYLCELSQRYRRLAERQTPRAKRPVLWINNHQGS